MKRVKVGAAFSDFVYKEDPLLTKTRRSEFNPIHEPHPRTFFFPVILFFCCIVLLGRLFYMQIIKGDSYRSLSDTNRTRTEVIHAPRGIIFDRNGKPLVYNMPGFREEKNGKTIFIDQKTAFELLANKDSKLEIDSLRDYPYNDAFTHIIGYVGQISQDELKEPDFKGYSSSDIIGKMGVEQEYEKYLKGAQGQKLLEVDAKGDVIRTLGQTDPVPGQNITLTIDASLQKEAYEAMDEQNKGTVIVSKPDGEILAMVSKPTFDPNLFTQGQYYNQAIGNYKSVEDVLDDSQNQPLLNRALAGVYPPGSTFKLIVAASGLESKKIDKNFTFEDTGILKVGNFSFSNWYFSQYGKTDGLINVVTAIKRSNDIFFYKLAELLGVDEISSIARKFGVGQKSGIDLVGEEEGLLPTKEWKQKTIGEDWYLGDDYHYGIGQGFLLTTPLQVNDWTQAIANGGILYKPHLLKSASKTISQDLLSSENFQLIREGMIEACSTGGVAWPLFNFSIKRQSNFKLDEKDFYTPTDATSSADQRVGIRIACKTGTAQHGTEDTLPHAWITLFAPAFNPEIIVTVLVESSGEGSNIAAPIAKKILNFYFTNEKN